MNSDIRIAITCPDHPKTQKLMRRLGDRSFWCLVKFWCFVAVNKPNGDISGYDEEDIEIGAGWLGEEGAFYKAIFDIGFIDKHENGSIYIHDWSEHNGWASSADDRSLSASKNQVYRWCVKDIKSKSGIDDFRKWYDSYKFVKGTSAKEVLESYKSNTNSYEVDTPVLPAGTESNTPSPYPSPSPLPSPLQKDKDKKKPATPRVSSERKEILELKPFYFSKEQWEELYTHRTKRKATQTPRAYSNLITEFDKAHASGMSADEILNAMSTGKGWAGFKLEWVRNNNGDQIKPRTVSDANSIRKEEMCGRLLEGLGGIFDENETGRINH